MITTFGTIPYEGLRWKELITEQFISVMSPTNYINSKLPDTTLINTAETPAAASALAAQAEKSYINTSTWSSDIIIVDDTVSLVPVTIPNPPRYKLQLAGILADGVPIPDTVQPEADSDSELCIYHPGRDKLWELWRARRDATGAWLCSDGGRMSFVSTSPGHWRSRTNGAVYPGLPTSPAGRDTFEVITWGVTAAKLPLLGLEITGEDIEAGVIQHALGFASLYNYIAPGKRWPAQGYDGNQPGAPLQEGMRFRFPPGYAIPGTLHSIAQMIATAARDYGLVLWDRAGSLSFRAERSVSALFGDTPAYAILAGFPWNDLQVIATGSDSIPNPV